MLKKKLVKSIFFAFSGVPEDKTRKSCCLLRVLPAAPPDVATVTRDRNAVPDLYSAGLLSIGKGVLSSKETLCEKIERLESQNMACDVLTMVNTEIRQRT